MGMGQCRFCTDRPSNVDHVGDGLGIKKLVICGAWVHYMMAHNVTLVTQLRELVLAIDPDTFSGRTLAYRSVRGIENPATVQIFFVEKNDGIHVTGTNVDVELFNHVRLLVLKCQATDVPPALPESGVTTAGGIVLSYHYDALLAQLKQGPASKKTTEWKKMAGVACRKLHDDLKSVDLGGLADDPDHHRVFNQLVQAAFLEAGFGSEVIRVIGFVSFPKAQELLAEDTVGLYPKGAVNLRAYTDGSYVDIYLERVNEYGNLR